LGGLRGRAGRLRPLRRGQGREGSEGGGGIERGAVGYRRAGAGGGRVHRLDKHVGLQPHLAGQAGAARRKGY
jgi:hypothetical protein